MHKLTTSVVRALALTVAVSALPISLFAQSGATITGQAAFTDYTQEHPGVRRKLTVADLPEPKPDESVDNGPSLVPRPEGAWPLAPKGFKVEMYAQGFKEPRLIRTAPNGDIFLADSHGDKIWSSEVLAPTAKRRRSRPLPRPASTFPSGSRSIPADRTPSGFMSGTPTPLCASPTSPAILSRQAQPRRSFQSFRVSPSSAAVAIGHAISSSHPMGRRCSSLSARPLTWTTLIRIPTSFTVQTFLSSPQKASS